MNKEKAPAVERAVFLTLQGNWTCKIVRSQSVATLYINGAKKRLIMKEHGHAEILIKIIQNWRKNMRKSFEFIFENINNNIYI